MITESTVFILGAGASCPYGFPTGEELRAEIIEKHLNDCAAWLRKNARSELSKSQGMTMAKLFVDTFRNSSTKSIDLFLGVNPEFKEDGKRAIIFRIIDAEKTSKFREEVEEKHKDWYSILFRSLTNELLKKDDYKNFSQNKVSFITFNYDRSLEHFLYQSFVNYFHGVEQAQLKEQFKAINFIHIFGQLANLCWQNTDCLEYGVSPQDIDIQSLTENIRTIYEEKKNPDLPIAQKLISEAKRLFFLGFGYAKENLELLDIPNCFQEGQEIYGTALGATKKEIDKIARSLLSAKVLPVTIHDWDCRQLLREYL